MCTTCSPVVFGAVAGVVVLGLGLGLVLGRHALSVLLWFGGLVSAMCAHVHPGAVAGVVVLGLVRHGVSLGLHTASLGLLLAAASFGLHI